MYAILSHTWREGEEVTFEELGTEAAKSKSGYCKIQQACCIAAEHGISYIWIDTCCIDKRSSSELSEAINSMFTWYKNSEVCYAYLEDVHFDGSDFANARWFTRGWTLQKLIAPGKVFFYSANWTRLGYKSYGELHHSGQNLLPQISRITGIDERALEKSRFLPAFSIARRMSWASQRETTRIEDEAYCLMGIFGINMPLLYGEGRDAFVRLQEEIMKTSTDHSLFAWTANSWFPTVPEGLFARSASDFKNAADIVAIGDDLDPYVLTNKGLAIRLPLLETKGSRGSAKTIGILNCFRVGVELAFFGIELSAIDTDKKTFVRLPSDEFSSVPLRELDSAEVKDIYILREEHARAAQEMSKGMGYMLLRSLPSNTTVFTINRRWDDLVPNTLIEMTYIDFSTPERVMGALCRYRGRSYAFVVERVFVSLSQYRFEIVHRNVPEDRSLRERYVTDLLMNIPERPERDEEYAKDIDKTCSQGQHFSPLKASLGYEMLRGQRLLVMDIDVVEQVKQK